MQVLASGIAAANKVMKAILPAPEALSETGRQERGLYGHFIAEEKAQSERGLLSMAYPPLCDTLLNS